MKYYKLIDPPGFARVARNYGLTYERFDNETKTWVERPGIGYNIMGMGGGCPNWEEITKDKAQKMIDAILAKT